MNYDFHPEAIAEYEDAARYYAACQPDLDLRFITCVENALTQISASPLRFRTFEPRFTFHGFRFVELGWVQAQPGSDAIIRSGGAG